MKNFRKQFMELTLIFAVINSVSMLKAFAQEIDYDDVNRQNAEIVTSRKQARSSKVADFFFEENYREVSLPKNRKLTSIEKDQKKLLQCAVKFVNKRKGFYKGPEILQGILVKAMDSEKLTADSYILNETTSECWDAYNNLTNFKQKKTLNNKLESAIKELSRTSAAEIKVAQFLHSQYFSKFQCISHNVSVSAGAIFTLGAGGSFLKCINNQGVVRKYLGPRIETAIGLGAKMEYRKDFEDTFFISGLIAGSVFELDNEESDSLTLGLGSSGNLNSKKSYESKTQSVGLSIDMELFRGSVNFRFFNGSRNWGHVIDQLN